MNTLDACLGSMNEEEKKWKELLKKLKFFKDEVKKRDIWLTKTEVDIIDTPEFQRLRRIFQLGPANLIFTGANHTRFEHSIGTLYKAQCIIDSINRNYEDFGEGRRLRLQEIFITRLAALLHDVLFITHGHILEDEGRILPKQWEDRERVNYLLLNENSNIRKALEKNFRKAFGKHKSSELTKQTIDLVIKIMSAKNERDIANLKEHAFIVDLIHNTICADLLDYLERDVFCTGIFGEYDTRMISYFIVEKHKNQPRLIIKLYKRKTDDLRWDVINNGILACLRLRCNLTTSVYFHHTRRKASAMITKMISAATKANLLDTKDFYELDDFSLPFYIKSTSEEILLKNENLPHERKRNLKVAKLLAERFQNRRLYETVLELSREDYRRSEAIMDRLVELTGWERRYDFETELEEVVDVEPGSVILYIPDKLKEKEPKMSLKEAQVLVKTKYGIETLEKLGDRDEFKLTVGMEIDNLKSSHKALFKVSLFVDPGLKAEKKESIKAICEQWLENKVPVSLVDALIRRNNIELRGESLTGAASKLYRDFQNQHFSRPVKVPRFTSFVQFVENRLKET